MIEPLLINAEQLTKVATHLRVTLHDFSQKVEQLDNSLAATMEFADTWIERLENLVSRMEKSNVSIR